MNCPDFHSQSESNKCLADIVAFFFFLRGRGLSQEESKTGLLWASTLCALCVLWVQSVTGRSGTVDSLRATDPTLKVLPPPLDTPEIQIHHQLWVGNICVVYSDIQVILVHLYLPSCSITLSTSSSVLASLTLYHEL